MMDDPMRLTVALAGVFAVGLLSWRLLSCWLDSTVLVHVLGLLLITSVLISVVVTSVNAHNNAPPNPALWLALGHRLACIGVAVMWRHWLTRTEAPYRRPLL